MSTLSYSQLERGVRILFNNQPHEIIEASSMFKGRGQSILQVKLKNLITGSIVSQSLKPSDSFQEAEIKKMKVCFIYSNKGKFVFSKKDNPGDRFELSKEQIGPAFKFLKPDLIIEAIIFKDNIVNISLPIKILLKVKEAPPGIKGDRAQGGNKLVVLETGAEMNVPLFIEQGSIVEVNTEKGEYVRRVEK